MTGRDYLLLSAASAAAYCGLLTTDPITGRPAAESLRSSQLLTTYCSPSVLSQAVRLRNLSAAFPILDRMAAAGTELLLRDWHYPQLALGR